MASELTLYFIPSPVGIDWTTPSTLALSAAKNKLTFKPHFMGHVWVEMKCGTDHELTGMVGKNFDYFNQVVLKQRGLGVLFHSFDGRLEDKKDILEEMEGYHKNGGMNFARFVITDTQCQRIQQYLKEYRQKNVGKYYGLVNRPRFGEGSGCSAFGASFLDVLNLIDEDIRKSWSQTVNIPLEFAGPPLRNEGVNILSLMMNAREWAKENEKHQKLTFWSPDLMYSWVQKKSAAKGDWKVVTTGQTVGVVFDRTQAPAANEPIWKN